MFWEETHTDATRLEFESDLLGVRALVEDGESQFLIGLVEFMPVARFT
jgi:hypothetical protein